MIVELHIASGVYAHTTAVCVLQSVPPGAIFISRLTFVVSIIHLFTV